MKVIREITTDKTLFTSNNHYSIFAERIEKENEFQFWVSIYRYKTSSIIKQEYVSELELSMLHTRYINS